MIRLQTVVPAYAPWQTAGAIQLSELHGCVGGAGGLGMTTGGEGGDVGGRYGLPLMKVHVPSVPKTVVEPLHSA